MSSIPESTHQQAQASSGYTSEPSSHGPTALAVCEDERYSGDDASSTGTPRLSKATLTPPLKWHGGKHYLASDLVSLMHPHLHYVEPFFGGGAVLLEKDPEGVSEVVNDLCGELTTFWRVLQGESTFAEFQRIVQAVPFSQVEWEDAADVEGTDIERSVAFFIRCRQSRAGQMGNFATLSRNRIRRGMNEQASAWQTAVEGLPEVAARLKRVVILHDDARRVIRSQDGPNTLFYLDPPYLHETRASTDVYAHEMAEEDHVDLLELVNSVKGYVMLSGYRSDLYDRLLSAPKWQRVEFDLPNNAGGGTTKRRMTECVWVNYELQE